jgi:hypothetical protein
LRTHALRLVKCQATDSGTDEESPSRSLSFIGIMNSGEGNLSIRHEEILREEFNRRP